MKTKHARQIRIGINARCLPYVTGGDAVRGYYTGLDFVRLRAYESAFQSAPSSLTVRAYWRTKPWKSTREEMK
jgi:hypothetical protein